MNLSIELKGTYHIDINDIVLKEIIEQYDGNYKEYLKNIKVDNEEINWFIEQKDYKTNQLEKALDEYISKNEYCSIKDKRDLIIKRKLNKFLHMVSSDEFNNLQQFFYNKAELSSVYKYADENNSRNEFNFVYFDDENVLSTNMKVLICNKNHSTHSNIFIPKIFCEAYVLLDNARIYYDKKESVIYLFLDGKVYKEQFKDFKFIDYKKVIPDKFEITIKTIDFIANSKTIMIDEKNSTRAFAYKLTNRYSCVSNKLLEDKYLCAMLELNFGLEYTGINDYSLPFVLFDEKKEYMQIVMPIILSNEEINKYL